MSNSLSSLSTSSYLKIGKSSKKLLTKLQFNPIQKQIELYERLLVEDDYWVEVREGGITYTGSDGELKIMRYSSVAHNNAISLLNKISTDLLRYGYGRVAEDTIDLGNVDKVAPLVINLMGKDDG